MAPKKIIKYIALHRTSIYSKSYVVLNVWNRTIDKIEPLDRIILNDVPKGLKLGIKYPMDKM